MSSPCSICRHPSAGSIDDLLWAGRSVRSVAIELGLSRDALGRHARRHLARRIDRSVNETTNGSPLVVHPLDELVGALRLRALAGDPVVAREYRLSLQAQSEAEAAQAPTVDLASTADWLALRSAMLAALEPYPEARQAIADVLVGLDR